jgi:hypothetical protein
MQSIPNEVCNIKQAGALKLTTVGVLPGCKYTVQWISEFILEKCHQPGTLGYSGTKSLKFMKASSDVLISDLFSFGHFASSSSGVLIFAISGYYIYQIKFE